MNLRLWALALACISGIGGAAAQLQASRQADFIVAVVNSEPITNSEVRAQVQRVSAQITQQGQKLPSPEELRRDALERLINERAQLQMARETGIRVDDWRAREGVEEVAFFEPRSPDEMLEFERLRAEAIEALLANDLPDVAEMVDTNLFSASVDPRLPPGVEPLLARMLILGQQTAVFIAPPGAL